MTKALPNIHEAEVEEVSVAEMDHLADWLKKYLEAKHLEAEAKARKEEFKQMITSYLEDQGAEFGSIGGKIKTRWRRIEQARIDTKRLRKELPAVAEEYENISVSHRLEVDEDE
jgi:predicted phage-related endonuclease